MDSKTNESTYEAPTVIDLGSVTEITLGALIGDPVDPDPTSGAPFYPMQ